MKDQKKLLKEYEAYENEMDWDVFIAWSLFNKHRKLTSMEEWKQFVENLTTDDQKKLSRASHFYYFICKPAPSTGDKEVRDEFRLVGIISLMEELMSHTQYKDFFSWYESKYRFSAIKNYKAIKDEYLKEFGATKKFKKYLETHFSEDDRLHCIKKIKKWNNQKNDFGEIKSTSELASFFYNMRSEFVHAARMQTFNRPGSLFSAISVKKTPYCIELEMDLFLNMFEKSFMNYWLNGGHR